SSWPGAVNLFGPTPGGGFGGGGVCLGLNPGPGGFGAGGAFGVGVGGAPGGFGGGGGACPLGGAPSFVGPSVYAGGSDYFYGGCGAGMGGAIFVNQGMLEVSCSTITQCRACPGSNNAATASSNALGLDGAIFQRNGVVRIVFSTLTTNQVGSTPS